MRAVITGATSGIGKEMAMYLSQLGYDLILTGRNQKQLEQMQKALPTKVEIIALDLSEDRAPFQFYNFCKGKQVDLLVNNAGYGLFGTFDQIDLEDELHMLNVNIRALHILTKLFLRDFRKRNYGYILNTASLAGFMAGPCFSSYYASKAYVVRMTQAVAEELRAEHSNVHLSMLCPGPVATEFIDTARVRFAVQPMPSAQVAEKAVREMFAGRLLITTDPVERAGIALLRLVPEGVLAYFTRLFQSSRERF